MRGNRRNHRHACAGNHHRSPDGQCVGGGACGGGDNQSVGIIGSQIVTVQAYLQVHHQPRLPLVDHNIVQGDKGGLLRLVRHAGFQKRALDDIAAFAQVFVQRLLDPVHRELRQKAEFPQVESDKGNVRSCKQASGGEHRAVPTEGKNRVALSGQFARRDKCAGIPQIGKRLGEPVLQQIFYAAPAQRFDKRQYRFGSSRLAHVADYSDPHRSTFGTIIGKNFRCNKQIFCPAVSGPSFSPEEGGANLRARAATGRRCYSEKEPPQSLRFVPLSAPGEESCPERIRSPSAVPVGSAGRFLPLPSPRTCRCCR